MNYMEEIIEAEKIEAQNNRLTWKERLVCCPVCRENLQAVELEELHRFKESTHLANNSFNRNGSGDIVVISEKMRKLQIDMKILYEKQKNAGGIIDLSESEVIVLTVS